MTVTTAGLSFSLVTAKDATWLAACDSSLAVDATLAGSLAGGSGAGAACASRNPVVDAIVKSEIERLGPDSLRTFICVTADNTLQIFLFVMVS
jgi:hypothetical protein